MHYMYELNVESQFSAAHNLRDYKGKCENLHGHNWKVRISVVAAELNPQGMALDFTVLKHNLDEVLSYLDHKYLNDVSPFDGINPTTENLARWISEKIAETLPEKVYVKAVTVWESEKCSATYYTGK